MRFRRNIGVKSLYYVNIAFDAKVGISLGRAQTNYSQQSVITLTYVTILFTPLVIALFTRQ